MHEMTRNNLYKSNCTMHGILVKYVTYGLYDRKCDCTSPAFNLSFPQHNAVLKHNILCSIFLSLMEINGSK